ncbi:hypothetical protein DSCO28_50880 [Desulfosarcina ovata subsp. sediminis]|uniref:Uncharacterized protein n=1 Tax=Desulfosarcina ovata subsp. sediminis TaxID=885957 RepID=A0A5K7ZW95_9BACT|nr:hypothetical protein [Desulfosarcina ovata]BBO84522.1 hypothetical protein DSCO28_50880 [Desulfosarcina ovata subsp. sediminis]
MGNLVIGVIDYNRHLSGVPVNIECEIFSLDTTTLSGHLELIDNVCADPIYFTVDHGVINRCIDAMKEKRSNVTAYREMTTNALGETKIKKFHVIGISNNP